MKLSRSETILKYIVEDYVKTAEPVGSKNLLANHKCHYSSATIRNVMADLEKKGLIEKTHTSSGRIPSIKGYRYYIEHLLDYDIDNNIKYEVDKIFNGSKSIEQIINESCMVLSNLTQLSTCVLGPNVSDEKLVKIEAVPINDSRYVVIFITNKGFVESKTFMMNENMNMSDIIKLVSYINERLNKINIIDLKNELDSNFKADDSELGREYAYLKEILISTFSDFFLKRGSRFYGKHNLFEQPEFKDNVEELKKLFDVFNSSDKLAEIFSTCGNEISISIGNGIYKDIAIITKDIKIPGTDHDIGRIAVLGPTRMDYKKVLQYLSYTTKMINNHLNDLKEVKLSGRE